ncbi:MAG: hypothetical protein R2941_11860 [Desulfobacterales bacterium]
MKIYCVAFALAVFAGCAQAPQLSEQKRISPHKKISAPSAQAGIRNFPQRKVRVPSLWLAERVHEFRPVPDGTIVRHDFVIKNIGDTVLILSKISAG